MCVLFFFLSEAESLLWAGILLSTPFVFLEHVASAGHVGNNVVSIG